MNRSPAESGDLEAEMDPITMGVVGAASVVGHLKSRKFVRRRLRFTKLVEMPGVGVAAGVATMLAAAPLVAVLPLVGAGTAVALGLGVGTGVSLGSRDARERPLEHDD